MTESEKNIQTLLAWAHWKSCEDQVSEEDLLLAKAVKDLYAQMVMYKKKCEGLQ